MRVASMVLGLIGAFLGLPSALCSGACAVGITATAAATAEESEVAGNTFMTLGLVAALIALISAILVMSKPKLGGAGLLLAFLLTAVTSVSLNPVAMLDALVLLVAAILGLAAKKPAAPGGATPAVA